MNFYKQTPFVYYFATTIIARWLLFNYRFLSTLPSAHYNDLNLHAEEMLDLLLYYKFFQLFIELKKRNNLLFWSNFTIIILRICIWGFWAILAVNANPKINWREIYEVRNVQRQDYFQKWHKSFLPIPLHKIQSSNVNFVNCLLLLLLLYLLL